MVHQVAYGNFECWVRTCYGQSMDTSILPLHDPSQPQHVRAVVLAKALQGYKLFWSSRDNPVSATCIVCWYSSAGRIFARELFRADMKEEEELPQIIQTPVSLLKTGQRRKNSDELGRVLLSIYIPPGDVSYSEEDPPFQSFEFQFKLKNDPADSYESTDSITTRRRVSSPPANSTQNDNAANISPQPEALVDVERAQSAPELPSTAPRNSAVDTRIGSQSAADRAAVEDSEESVDHNLSNVILHYPNKDDTQETSRNIESHQDQLLIRHPKRGREEVQDARSETEQPPRYSQSSDLEKHETLAKKMRTNREKLQEMDATIEELEKIKKMQELEVQALFEGQVSQRLDRIHKLKEEIRANEDLLSELSAGGEEAIDKS